MRRASINRNRYNLETISPDTKYDDKAVTLQIIMVLGLENKLLHIIMPSRYLLIWLSLIFSESQGCECRTAQESVWS